MTMRIAYLAQSYPPMISGAAIFAQNLARAMAQRGHKVIVIAASDRGDPYHTLMDNLTVMRLRSVNNPLRVGQRLIAYPRRRVLKALNQFKPDIVHTHDPLQMGILALDYSKRAQVPVTLTTHQLPWFATSYIAKPLRPVAEKMLWIYAHKLIQNYASLISPTQTIATIIEETIGPRANVISYGLDLKTFHPPPSLDTGFVTRSKLNLPLDAPVILHVGRLDSDKRVDQVICAVTPALRESDAHLLVAGDGRQRKNLILLCRKLGIEKRVHFMGFISQQDLPEIYRLANIFVTTSEIETQGIVLLEAAASGLPIVAVDATCISEIVHDEVNGFLIKPDDINTFSQAIIELVRNPSKSRFMGRKGRMLAEQHNVRHTWALHENLYQKMINQPRYEHAKQNNLFFNPWKMMKTWIGLK